MKVYTFLYVWKLEFVSVAEELNKISHIPVLVVKK